MRGALALILAAVLALCLCTPCRALDTGRLKQALPEEAAEMLQQVSPDRLDVQGGFSALLEAAKTLLRQGLKTAMQSAFLMTAVCLLLSLLHQFAKSAGTALPAKAPEIAGATAILTLALQQNGALLEHCRGAIGNLDTFTKVLFGMFAVASAAAGRPASAVATTGAAMLFSQMVFTLSLRVFLPGVTLYLLLVYGGILSENGALHQAAAVGKWGITTFFKVFLTAYFAYLSFTGLVTGTADAAAVRTAQSLSSTVPLVGSVISGASETLLAGASLLRAGVGLLGFLGAAAICLAPFLQGVCHLLVFRVLSVLAASFTEGGSKTMLDALSQAYSMLVGILTACCAVQFITIVVSMTVTGT